MFFDLVVKKQPYSLFELYAEIYVLAVKESMAMLNKYCRYQFPEESCDVLPPEFVIIPMPNRPVCSVAVKAGVSMTDALDSIFHDIKSDVGGPQKVIDCLVANILVASQAARYLFNNDESFNAFVDHSRGGRDKPIWLREITITSKVNVNCDNLFLKFGVPSLQQATLNRLQGLVYFGHMRQFDCDGYNKKHQYLNSCGFHYILLPDQSVLAFAPDVNGRFDSLEDLAKFLVKEMNSDLSIQEWHVHIRYIYQGLSNEGCEFENDTLENMLSVSSSNFPGFLQLIMEISKIITNPSHIEPPQRQQAVSLINSAGIRLSSQEDTSILSLLLSLKIILDLNEIKTTADANTYRSMVEQAKQNRSSLDITNIPSDFIIGTRSFFNERRPSIPSAAGELPKPM